MRAQQRKRVKQKRVILVENRQMERRQVWQRAIEEEKLNISLIETYFHHCLAPHGEFNTSESHCAASNHQIKDKAASVVCSLRYGNVQRVHVVDCSNQEINEYYDSMSYFGTEEKVFCVWFWSHCKRVREKILYFNEYFMKRTNSLIDRYAYNVHGIKNYLRQAEFTSGRKQIHIHLLRITKNKAYLLAFLELKLKRNK